VVSVLTVTLIVLASPAVSRAACGGTQVAYAGTHPRGQLPPLAIGDSTMILSLPGLSAAGWTADAHGCRNIGQALGMLGQLRAQRALPHMVAIALGSNGGLASSDIDDALGLICCGRILVLVTPRLLGGGSGAPAAIERAAARAHPDRVLLLDWVADAAGHPEWFQPDGLHLTLSGVAAFNTLLARALPYAYVPCPPITGRHARARTRHGGGRRATNPASAISAVAAPSPALALHLTRAHLGYITATVSGPPGVSVQLADQLAGASRPIGTVTLPASGVVIVARAASWLCAPRLRTLTATTLAPAAATTAAATITTPSCARRLSLRVDRRARAGGSLSVRLHDRWRLGGLAPSICIASPGARPTCSRWYLRAPQTSRTVAFATPRIGGWTVTIRTPYDKPRSSIVWVSHPGPIRLLAAGDSEMQLLDDFIGQDLAPYGVATTSDARISTGLTNSFFFDWPNHARAQAPALRPDVTVIFMGANDGFAVTGPHGAPVQCCSSDWSAGYANLVAEMMRIYLLGTSGRVYWVVLPEPRPANFQNLFHAVNAGIRQAAQRFPGRVGLIDADAIFTPGGQYRDFMTYGGRGFVIHESDGIHLSVASDQVAADVFQHQLLRDRVIR
jgi:lysophospholipase L1-like esterase